MLDYPRIVIVGLRSILKFGFDPMYSLGDIAIFIFWRFGLKLPIHAHFWEVLGIDREFEFYEFFSFLKFNEFYEFFFGWKKSVKIRNFANHRCLSFY